jgi:DNA-binding NtrC family response regulator
VIDRAAILCEGGSIDPCHLPGSLLGDCGPQPLLAGSASATDVRWDGADHFEATSGRGLRDALRHYEMLLIERALASTGGNQSRAAVLLQIPRRTLVRKLRGS